MGNLIENTVAITLTDTSAALTDLVDTALSKTVSWGSVTAATITAETNDCRIAFGVDASTTVGHVLAAGQSMRIPNADMITNANLINAISGSDSVVQITLEA